MARRHNSGSAVKDCFTILHNERAKRDMEIMLKVFSKFGQFGHFGPKMVRPHNIGSALCLFF